MEGGKKGFHPYGQDGYVGGVWEARSVVTKTEETGEADIHSRNNSTGAAGRGDWGE